MASLFTHVIAAFPLGQLGPEEQRWSGRFWAAAFLCSVIPDVDVIGFSFGIRYGNMWGHHGMTHSLLFAFVIGLIAGWLVSPDKRSRWYTVLILFAITASHGVLDAMTNGGLGVVFFSPFDTHRYFLAWRPLQVSPISVGRFFSVRGQEVLKSEFLWIWLPSFLLATGVVALR